MGKQQKKYCISQCNWSGRQLMLTHILWEEKKLDGPTAFLQFISSSLTSGVHAGHCLAQTTRKQHYGWVSISHRLPNFQSSCSSDRNCSGSRSSTSQSKLSRPGHFRDRSCAAAERGWAASPEPPPLPPRAGPSAAGRESTSHVALSPLAHALLLRSQDSAQLQPPLHTNK